MTEVEEVGNRQARQEAVTLEADFEGRKRVSSLVDVLQLRARVKEPLHSLNDFLSQVRPADVSICGVRFSDILDPSLEDVSRALKVASGLGYLLQFLDLAAYYMDIPVFHFLVYQGSTSRLFYPLPSGQRPIPPENCGIDELPNFLSDPAPATNAVEPSTGFMQKTRKLYSIAKLTEQWENFRQGSVAPVVTRPGQAMQPFLRSLCQSLASFTAHQLGPDLGHLHPHAHPLMAFAGVCLIISEGPGAKSHLRSRSVGQYHQHCTVLGIASTMLVSTMEDDGWSVLPASRKHRGMEKRGSDEDLKQWEQVGRGEIATVYWDTNNRYFMNTAVTLRSLTPRAAVAAAQRLATLSPGAIAAAQEHLATAQSAASQVTAQLLNPIRRRLGSK
eukprot:jgi/Botrbrau1/17173/Bobra.0157s0065.2